MRWLTFPACASGRAGPSPEPWRDRGCAGTRRGFPGRVQPEPGGPGGDTRTLLPAWPAEGEWLCQEAAPCRYCPGGIPGPWPAAGRRGWRERPSCPCPLGGALWAVLGQGSLSPWHLPALPQSLSWLCPPAPALCSQSAPAHLCLADALSLTTLSWCPVLPFLLLLRSLSPASPQLSHCLHSLPWQGCPFELLSEDLPHATLMWQWQDRTACGPRLWCLHL